MTSSSTPVTNGSNNNVPLENNDELDEEEGEEQTSAFFPYSSLPSATASASASTKSIPLLDEMLEGMALSMLIFLMADLRLLSATGRISLKWESMVLDNDLMLRTTATQVAGLMPNLEEHLINQQQGQFCDQYNHARAGLSPAQLMAMVLVETKKTIDAKKLKEQEKLQTLENALRQSSSTGGISGPSRNRLDSTSHVQQQDIFSPVADIAATGHKEELNPLLKAWLHIVAANLNRDVPSIEARRSTLSLLIDPKELAFDEAHDEDEEEEGEEASDVFVDATPRIDQPSSPERIPSTRQTKTNGDKIWSSRKNFLRKSSMAHSHDGGDDESQSQRPNLLTAAAAAAHQVQENVDRHMHNMQEKRKSIMMTQKQRDQLQVQVTTDTLFDMGQKQPRVRASVIHSLEAEKRDEGIGRNLSSEELLLIMERAVESRVHDKLNFMSSFFRRGTICRLMCKSNARVVWINDWYPLKVSLFSKQCFVCIFRLHCVPYSCMYGTTGFDLCHCCRSRQKAASRPISGCYYQAGLEQIHGVRTKKSEEPNS